MSEEAEMEASKAPLLDHLIELRARLVRALIAFAIMTALCFWQSGLLYDVLLVPMKCAKVGTIVTWACANDPKTVVEAIYTAPHEFFFHADEARFFWRHFARFASDRVRALEVCGARFVPQ